MDCISYNKVQINEGDTVYQMDAARVKVLTFVVQKAHSTGLLEVTGGLPNYHLSFTAPARQFHTDKVALVKEWLDKNLHNYEVTMPKFLYSLHKLYQDVGGEVTPEQMNRFALVQKDEVI
jgi:hypothetical protein